ncbi:tetratricopeptide repeat protein [Nostoc punctiforme]|uniref:Tetratricopeptide TPR_2 repeat protein n=1 Tax=Nostoc punctiforme (strain ATCC 29133 / PCC 73102) TaxID=63737 RepID=B2J1R6_NOSP7|nr:tetratricopeptide repeat protein [Nostoc punctiforme]ACC81918.1 Tetratricopeptide TPR_2 repeat protein [Nostoc punctiforme PCC 73102]
MNPNLSDWDDDLPPEPEEAYQDLLRALRRKSGFGLFFVQCTPVEADNLIIKLPQEIPQKKIAVLRFVEAIDNLYQPVAESVKDKQVDILLIKGLEYSLYKYEKRSFGEITEGQFSNLISVPHILNHLNQQRERFRDDFPISFVFLLRSFSINYFIHRAPDFFDWRSGVFELPTAPEVVEQESTRLLLEGDYEEYLKLSSEQKIEKVIEIQDLLTEKDQPESRKAGLLVEQGNLLDAAKEYEAAITSYNQALKFQPDYYQAWNNQGKALRNLGRYEEALASFEQALKFQPDDYIVLNNKGIELWNLRRYEEALASYNEAVQIKPDDPQAWYNRGITLWDLERYEEALASYNEAVQIKPDYQEAWHNQGNTLGKLERYEEALASYVRTVTIQPDKHEAWHGKGFALGQLGCDEEALTAFNEALKIKPDYHQAWYNRGHALSNLGRNEEAIASYDQALKIKPDYHYAWYYKGAALIKLGRWKEGNKSINKAIEINPDFVKNIFNIQNKQIITSLLQKLGFQKLVQIAISFLRIIEFRG